MVVSTMETLKTARRKDMVSIPIQMVVDTKASTSMARKRGKEHFSGLMDVRMKGAEEWEETRNRILHESLWNNH